jgi:CubicO group peptidase (beta-lactamase class C family)
VTEAERLEAGIRLQTLTLSPQDVPVGYQLFRPPALVYPAAGVLGRVLAGRDPAGALAPLAVRRPLLQWSAIFAPAERRDAPVFLLASLAADAEAAQRQLAELVAGDPRAEVTHVAPPSFLGEGAVAARSRRPDFYAPGDDLVTYTIGWARGPLVLATVMEGQVEELTVVAFARALDAAFRPAPCPAPMPAPSPIIRLWCTPTDDSHLAILARLPDSSARNTRQTASVCGVTLQRPHHGVGLVLRKGDHRCCQLLDHQRAARGGRIICVRPALLLGLIALSVATLSGDASAGSSVMSSRQSVPLVSTADDWPAVAPEQEGLDSARLAEALMEIRRRGLNIHSLLLVRDGQTVLDATFYPYDGSTPHDLASVTKSVTTTLLGIAVDQGTLRLNQTLLSFFQEVTVANRDARKERITLADLASMRSGLECLGPPTDPDEPTLQAVFASSDWVQFALDLPMVAEPGTAYAYCSPATHLLSAVLTRATGMSTLEFARRYLFEPLGIREALWPEDPQGVTRGWGDLYLYPSDAAKLGYLWLNQGVWEGQPVVSRAWVRDSVQVHTVLPGGEDYGYGWWILRDSPVGGQYAAEGRGGQRVMVFPALNAVIVTTGGRFQPGDATDLLAPALVDPSRALPPNPAGVARLNEALAAVRQQPVPAVRGLPDMARAVSGVTYVFEPNAAQIKKLMLEFISPAEAKVTIALYVGTAPPPLMVGLDGVFRMTPTPSHERFGFPVGVRGTWEDDHTFFLEIDTIANNRADLLRLSFEEDRVVIDARERTREATLRLIGVAQRR